MKIFHHNDDDGRCAAAIVKHFMNDLGQPMDDADFIEYGHSGTIDCDIDSIQNQFVYIVDLALDDVIMNLIRILDSNKCTVVHIDHHKTTFDYLQKLSEDLNTADLFHINNITHFYVNGVSGAMLTYIYSCMYDDERVNPEETFKQCTFREKRSHIVFYPETMKERPLRIPMLIRYIDDNDVWLHDIPETKYFNMAFSMELDKHPNHETWGLLDKNDLILMQTYLPRGETIWMYKQAEYQRILKSAHTIRLHTDADDPTQLIDATAVNTGGNSRVFGDTMTDDGVYVLYHYNGKKWYFSLYSTKDGIDVSEIATLYGGGGHIHASGFQIEQLDYEENTGYQFDPPVLKLPANQTADVTMTETPEEEKKLTLWQRIKKLFAK